MFGGRFSSSIGAVGVDMGTTAVKMLQLQMSGGRLKVIGAARLQGPPAGSRDREWIPSEADLLGAFRSGGFVGRRCVVCLPRNQVHVQTARLPKLSEREMPQAVAWEASHRFKLERQAMESDYIATGAVVHGGESREETLVVAASHRSINARIDPLMAAGLRPLALETDFTALARFVSQQFRSKEPTPGVQAVVEIGSAGSSMIILRDEQICFFRQIAVSGAMLNRAVCEHLQLDEQAAAELRIARLAAAGSTASAGSTLDASTDRAVFEAVRSHLNDLAHEVVLCLRYYGVAFRGLPPRQIILCGGDGPEPGLAALLEQRCEMPVIIDTPDLAMEGLELEIRSCLNRTPGPACGWAVAGGLSLRSVKGLSEREASAA